MNYGKAFRIIRATYNLGQGDLAKLLRIGQSHVSLIESGKRQPGREVIAALADSLRVPEALIHLLASEPKSLMDQDPALVEALARSLLRLLVSASDEAIQQAIPYPPQEDS